MQRVGDIKPRQSQQLFALALSQPCFLAEENRALFDKSWKAGKLGIVKTTIDLPESLVREMKLRAVKEGRKIKDVAADVFRAGLRDCAAQPDRKAYSQKLDAPAFVCETGKSQAAAMSVAELLR